MTPRRPEGDPSPSEADPDPVTHPLQEGHRQVTVQELLDTLAELVAAKVAERLPATAPRDGYLDVEAAAEYLACPASRVYELKASGRLAHYKDGQRLLFRRADLDACLERGGET